MNYIIDAVTTNYWNFKGRSSRTAFWMLILAQLVNLSLSFMVQGLVATENAFLLILAIPLGLVSVVISFFLLIPSLAMSFRRYHDSNYSFWFSLVPVFNLYLAILMYFARGTVGANNYGDDPTDTPNGTTNPEVVIAPQIPLATPTQS